MLAPGKKQEHRRSTPKSTRVHSMYGGALQLRRFSDNLRRGSVNTLFSGLKLKPGTGYVSGTSISQRLKGSPGTSYCSRSTSSLLAVAVLCPREEWCVASATAIATVIRSCLYHEWRRRSRLRRAEPPPRSTCIDC